MFLAERDEAARQYAWARASVDFKAGGEAVGLVVTVEMSADELEPDPFEPLHEPGQHLLRRDVSPAEVVEMCNVDFGWRRSSVGGFPFVVPSLDLVKADSMALAMRRVRQQGVDRWRPATLSDVAADIAAMQPIRHPRH